MGRVPLQIETSGLRACEFIFVVLGRCLLLLRMRSGHLEILGFPMVMLTSAGIFLRSLKLFGESRT